MALKSSPTLSNVNRSHIFTHLALILVCFVIGFPMIFTLIKSTQSIGQIFAFPQNFMPGTQIVQNYAEAWTTTKIGSLMPSGRARSGE